MGAAANPAQAGIPGPRGGPVSTPQDRPPAAEILQDEALLALGTSGEDAETTGHRIRFLTGAARIEHGIAPDEWLTPEQVARLQQLASLADQLAAGARAVLAGLAPAGG